MSKTERIAEFVRSLDVDAAHHDARYLGYFACFDRGDYYEAHDVLEDLWLGEAGPDRDFYKGLIQIAGAFVHMKKQIQRPEHPKDGRRLQPAARLLGMASRNLERFSPLHHDLKVEELRNRCGEIEMALIDGKHQRNPLTSELHPLNFAHFLQRS